MGFCGRKTLAAPITAGHDDSPALDPRRVRRAVPQCDYAADLGFRRDRLSPFAQSFVRDAGLSAFLREMVRDVRPLHLRQPERRRTLRPPGAVCGALAR